MDTSAAQKGFIRLDFDEIKRVGELVGFDIVACARTKKSCGPGCDWLVQDKRYYTLMLLRHIESIMQHKATLSDEVLLWYEKASDAAKEYKDMEEKLYPVYRKKA